MIDSIHADDGPDPLLRMAIAHHQFESIRPFYDGNGRTGRILNLLMLQREGLLDLPVLYLSRYITTTKPDYYRLLQTVRDEERWSEWCLYLLRGVAVTSRSAITLVRAFRDLMQKTKHDLRGRLPKLYSQDLLNSIFLFRRTPFANRSKSSRRKIEHGGRRRLHASPIRSIRRMRGAPRRWQNPLT